MTPLTLTRGIQIIEILLDDNDGKHAPEIIELVRGLAPPESFIAHELEKRAYARTREFDSAFEKYLKELDEAEADMPELAAAANS